MSDDFAAAMNAIASNFMENTDQRLLQSRDAIEQWGDDTAQLMQVTARWVDQSGDAREGLHAEPDHPPELREGGQVRLAHGVFYGEFLEKNPEFEIIRNTVETAAPDLFAALDRIW